MAVLMRVLLATLVAAVGCAPEVAPGSYLCGPNASCPEGQGCNAVDDTCVLPGLVRPFDCTSDVAAEPDDSAETGYTLMNLDCTTLPVVIDGCLFADDSADWVRLPIPASCGTVDIDARVSFPIAFQQLALSLVDTTSGAEIAADIDCTVNEGGDVLRCLAASLTGGVTYAIGVAPTGDGDCDGDCAFNRYTLRAQLK